MKGIKTIDDFKKFLIDYFKDIKVEIYLFGSRARGDNSCFSDVDVGILSNENISDKIVLLKELLEESTFPYKVDIVNLSSNSKLREIAMKEGVRWL